MSESLKAYFRLIEKYHGLEPHEFARDLAMVQDHFLQDQINNKKILCAIVSPKDDGLLYEYVGVDPVLFAKDKKAILKYRNIQEGEVFLPIEFKQFLH